MPPSGTYAARSPAQRASSAGSNDCKIRANGFGSGNPWESESTAARRPAPCKLARPGAEGAPRKLNRPQAPHG